MSAQRQHAQAPTWFRPLPPGRNFALVVERLRRAIDAGELTPGDKLPSEPELASLFGLSRSVVREALKVLELSGYLEVRRGYGGGTFVCAPRAEEFTTVPPPPLPAVSVSGRQLNEVRLAIEPFASGLAAAGRPEAGGLHASIEQMRARPERPAEVLRGAFDFHVEVARMSGNPLFIGVLETLRPAAYWAIRHGVADPGWRDQTAQDHAAIAAAIASGDAANAEELMRAHLRRDARP